MLQRDVSLGNTLILEDETEGFLNDMDLAVLETRTEPSGAPAKTGTRPFMAIGALYNEPHNFMHDLESFFWVLFWIGVHWNGPDKVMTSVKEYESWNYMRAEELGNVKSGTVVEEGRFGWTIEKHFTPYCQPLIPCVKDLREVVFPDGKRWLTEDEGLYSRMRAILAKAREDLKASTVLDSS